MIATSLARWSLLDEGAVISMKKQSERNSAGQSAINRNHRDSERCITMRDWSAVSL